MKIEYTEKNNSVTFEKSMGLFKVTTGSGSVWLTRLDVERLAAFSYMPIDRDPGRVME